MKFSMMVGLTLVLGFLPTLASAASHGDACSIANDIVQEGSAIRGLLTTSIDVGFLKYKEKTTFCEKLMHHSKKMSRRSLEAYNRVSSEGRLRHNMNIFLNETLSFEKRANSFCTAEVAPEDILEDLSRYFDNTIVNHGAKLYVGACGVPAVAKSDKQLEVEQADSTEIKEIFGSRPKNHLRSGDNEVPGSMPIR